MNVKNVKNWFNKHKVELMAGCLAGIVVAGYKRYTNPKPHYAKVWLDSDDFNVVKEGWFEIPVPSCWANYVVRIDDNVNVKNATVLFNAGVSEDTMSDILDEIARDLQKNVVGLIKNE